jgi:threonine/homoserine/homoserine lactone efflux protein
MFKPEFLLTSLIVVLIPGTGVVYTITTGLTLPWRASVAAAIGCTLGIVPHILARLYLAWNMWREAGSLEINKKSRKPASQK